MKLLPVNALDMTANENPIQNLPMSSGETTCSVVSEMFVAVVVDSGWSVVLIPP